MLRQNANVNMKVIFGRPGENAEKSVGKIVKTNPTRAIVELLEERGTRKTHPVGTKFNVPYSLMEPFEGNKNTTTETIDTTIKPGTTFRFTYADGNPKWKVVAKTGINTWLCEIINEPIIINGRTYQSDFIGVKKAFLTNEIKQSLHMSQVFNDLKDKNQKFYDSLKEGQIVHYHNGFNTWVRCIVVTNENHKNVLKPIALLGEWRDYDLPRLLEDGSIHNPYQVQKIIEGTTFAPHYSFIFESGSDSLNNLSNPTQLKPIDLNTPQLTPDQQIRAEKVKMVHEIQELTKVDLKTQDPDLVLDAITQLLQKRIR